MESHSPNNIKPEEEVCVCLVDCGLVLEVGAEVGGVEVSLLLGGGARRGVLSRGRVRIHE